MENKEKGWVLIYDIKSLPKDKTINDIKNECLEKGIIKWDSSNNGHKPKVVNLGGNKNEYFKDCDVIDIFECEPPEIKSEEIVWYFKDNEVGRCHLPECTLGGFRDWLAFNEGVLEYDNVVFLTNGKVRMDGKINLFEGKPYGEFAGKQYEERRKNGYFK